MGLLNERQAAEWLGCSVGLLRRWRRNNEGPTTVRLGRLVRYRREALNEFIERNEQAAA
jgi:excisionase family DNA binding protein